MSEDRSSNDLGDKSWIEKISAAFSAEPKSKADLIELLDMSHSNDLIDSDALNIIKGALEVAELQARDVMVPRPQMVILRDDCERKDYLQVIVESGHSRFPVVGENIDEVRGILLAKDILPTLINGGENTKLSDLVRPAVCVPESKRLNVLLREFRENRNHMAIVIDEYGGVSGLITIEDILEEIVGEIEDETDEDSDIFIRKVNDKDYVIKALTPIDDFNDYFKSQLDDSEYETIGGLIMQSFGYMPKRNEITEINGFTFRVVNADNRQLHLLRLSLEG
ncbi:MAG TPA: transporter associated domain-containing protein [Pseudomonadales bacterium]|nr:transporter associated domain-containing protein [Pseudomonadales bacterium]